MEAKSCAAHLAGVAFNERNNRFDSLLPGDMVEVKQLPREIQITMGEDIQGEREEEIYFCVFNYLSAHFAQKFLRALGAATITATTT